MAGLLDYLPLQVRTLIGTARGDTSPITEKNLDYDERSRIADAILASRTYKQSLLDLKNDNALKDWQQKEYAKYFPNQKAVDMFKSGSGAVGYDDYYNAGQSASDWNFLPSGGIRNTLGQFRYNTDKQGNINIKDRYDFTNDTIEGLPKSVSDSRRYEKMSLPEKIATLRMETLYMPEVGFNPILGFRSLPSRFGNAFVGNKGRDVNITLPSTYHKINPSVDDLYKTRIDLTK